MPVSEVQAAKRAFASVLLQLAGKYGVQVDVTREAADSDLEAAFRKRRGAF